MNEEALAHWRAVAPKTKYSEESTVQIQGKKALYKLVLSVRPYVHTFDWSRFLVVKYSAFELHWKDSFMKIQAT